MKRKEFIGLLLLTVLALLIHGYHPGAEDSEIYVPGVEKVLHPNLFPVGGEYFQLHAHLTLFPQLIAGSVRATHLPLIWILFLWQLASIFLFLLACRILLGKLFPSSRAIWGGVVLVTVLLTLPVSGTALYIMDQYINPRNLTAFAVVFAVVYVLEKKYWRAAVILIFATSIHPFMTAFAISYCILLGWINNLTEKKTPPPLPGRRRSAVTSMWALPLVAIASTPKGYHDAAVSHAYQYLLQWHWYEILGAVAPLAILWWLRSLARKRNLRNVAVVCQSLVIYGAVYCCVGVLFSSSNVFESIARLQPMRSLYLLYILMILIGGGFLAEHVLKAHPLRWIVLFLPLAAGMYFAQLSLFPASAHVEWPWAASRNLWVQSFQWIRANTPQDAVFAIDPWYMNLPGEDLNGFRAIAQRSHLADASKDSGVVEMFPKIADDWQRQVQAQTGLNHFRLADFQRLKAEYGVSWVLLQQPDNVDLECPYQNRAVKVCRLP
ncbi:MAG: DUF6798 domain-containing protein [Acidobacteriaceae bacterium]